MAAVSKPLARDFRMDYIWTMLSHIFVGGAGFASYYLAKRISPELFAEFAVSKRLLGWIIPIFILGLGVSLPRAIAYARAHDKPEVAATLLTSAVIVYIAVCIAAVGICLLIPGPIAGLLFGDPGRSHLTIPLMVFVAGLGINSLVFSFFRGIQGVSAANWLDIVAVAIVPSVALLAGLPSAASVLIASGVGCAFFACLFALVRTRAGDLGQLRWDAGAARELLGYGLRRVPGDAAFYGLLALPAVVSAHTIEFQAAGDFSFVLALLGLVVTPINPIAVLMLPRATEMIHRGQSAELAHQVKRLVMATLGVSGLIAGIGLAMVPWLIQKFSYGGSEMVAAARLILVGALPYSVFICLRSIVDAAHERAINSRNCILALGIFLLLALGFRGNFSGPVMLVTALIAALAVLTVLTMWEVRQIFRMPNSELDSEFDENELEPVI